MMKRLERDPERERRDSQEQLWLLGDPDHGFNLRRELGPFGDLDHQIKHHSKRLEGQPMISITNSNASYEEVFDSGHLTRNIKSSSRSS
jgi:hypothetical protein